MIINDVFFETLNPSTKKAKALRRNYQLSSMKTLSDAYAKPSEAKQKIYNYWLEYANSTFEQVSAFAIPTKNYMTFTIAFCARITHSSPWGLYYITPTHNYVMRMF